MRETTGRAAAAGFTHVAFGDLFLEDVRRYREDRLAGTGLTPLFPIWGQPTDALARDMLAAGLDAILTCVNPAVLDGRFAGRRFDASLLGDLPARSIRAANAASFIPSAARARCSRRRFRSRPASSSSATGMSLPMLFFPRRLT